MLEPPSRTNEFYQYQQSVVSICRCVQCMYICIIRRVSVTVRDDLRIWNGQKWIIWQYTTLDWIIVLKKLIYVYVPHRVTRLDFVLKTWVAGERPHYTLGPTHCNTSRATHPITLHFECSVCRGSMTQKGETDGHAGLSTKSWNHSLFGYGKTNEGRCNMT